MRRLLCTLCLLVLALANGDCRAQDLELAYRLSVSPGTMTRHFDPKADVRDWQPGGGVFLDVQPGDSPWSFGLAGLAVSDSNRRPCSLAAASSTRELWAWGSLHLGLGVLAGWLSKTEYTGPMALPVVNLRLDLGRWFLGARVSALPPVNGHCAALVFLPDIGVRF